MYQPTQFVEETLSTSAIIRAEDTQKFEETLHKAEEFRALLERHQRERYFNQESVFSKDLISEVSDKVGTLPETYKEDLLGRTNGRWLSVYDGILYYNRGWTDSYENQFAGGEEEYNESFVVFDLDEVRFGEGVVEVPLNGEMVPVYIEEELEQFAEAGYGRLSISFYNEEYRQLMSQIAEVELNDIEVNLLWPLKRPRRYVPLEVYDDYYHDDADLLSTFNDPFENIDELEVLLSLVDKNGAYTYDRVIKVALYVNGLMDTIALDYGYFTPQFTWNLAQALGDFTAHIPQMGEILISTEPLDEFQSYSDEFPEKQNLTEEQRRELYSRLEFPSDVVDRLATDDPRSIGKGKEKLAQMYETRTINDTEVADYELCPWNACGTEDSVYEAIEFGEIVRESLCYIDNKFNLELGAGVLHHVDVEGKKVHW